ncbi:MAG: O-antigen ligase family protein [Anaerolineae bacterium]|nr:O-antigen ligase family protein [Anaerolineae bacterium]
MPTTSSFSRFHAVGFTLFVVLAMALLASAARPSFTPRGERAPAPFTDRPLRIGVNVALERADEATVEATLDAIAAAGLIWVRQRFPWDAIEPEPGVFHWERWDHLVDAVRTRGLHLIAVLDGSPTWARPQNPDNPLAPPLDPITFGCFATAFAARYGDRIDHYQIWDEPNIQPHWSGEIHPAGYVALLREGALAVRRADPGAVVLTAALAPTLEQGPWNLSDILFLREMYRAGAAPWFDVVAAQPFGFEEAPDQPPTTHRLNFARVVMLRTEMEYAGDDEKPIWGVRFGWHTPTQPSEHSIWGSVSPTEQVTWTEAAIRRTKMEWPWLGALLWAVWQPAANGSWAAPPDDPLWGFALMERDGRPRATLSALTAAARPQNIAWPGRYDMSHPALRWEGSWRRAGGAADVGRSGDALIIPFYGTRLDLRVQRGRYWALLWVEVDGRPANALPRDAAGRSYLVLYDPLGRAEWVTVARHLSPGEHQVKLIAEGGWGQWALNGFAVAYERPTSASWPVVVAFLGALAVGVMARWAWSRHISRRYALHPLAALHHLLPVLQAAPTVSSSVALMFSVLAYAGLPWPWAIAPLLLAGWLIARAPEPGLAMIAFWAPFYYVQKPLSGEWLSHAEALVAATLVWRVLSLLRGVPSLLRSCGENLRVLCGFSGAIPSRSVQGFLRALDGTVLAFVLVGVISAWIAPDRGAAWTALRRLILVPASLYLLWRTLPVSRQTADWTAGAWIVSGVVISLIGLVGYLESSTVVAGGVARLRSVYYSPNEAALLLVRVWPLAMSIALAGRDRWRLPALGAAMAMLLALLLTFSRGAWLLGVPTGALALALFIPLVSASSSAQGRALSWLARRSWGLWIALAAVGAGLVWASRGWGTALRPEVWQAAWAMWRDHPWLGVGLDGFQWAYPRYMALDAWREPLLYHPHNLVLELGTWMGTLGLLAMVAIIYAWAKLWRAAMRMAPSPVLVGVAAGWTAGLVHGLVDAAFFLPHLAFLTMTALGVTAAYKVDLPSRRARIE